MSIVGQSPECCRHCSKGCRGYYDGENLPHYATVPVEQYDGRMIDTIAASWFSGDCPACAEVERIVKAIDSDLEQLRANRSPWLTLLVRGLNRAAKIARGEL